MNRYFTSRVMGESELEEFASKVESLIKEKQEIELIDLSDEDLDFIFNE